LSADNQDEPGFASRWSRLKQEANAPPEEVAAEAEAELEAPVEDDRSDEEVLEEMGLPDPDTLKSGDNFSAFMAKAVPARLRNRALRKLWISDPVLANLDELIDYGDDFTDAANVIENLQTSYQVGKGFVDKATELSKADDAGAEEPAGEQAEAVTDEPAETPAGEQAGEQVAVGEESATEDGSPAELTESEPPGETAAELAIPEPEMPLRRRMRFRVAEE